jgi:hypothetical protein
MASNWAICAAVIVLVLAASPAGAATITFGSATVGAFDCGTSYYEAGYKVTSHSWYSSFGDPLNGLPNDPGLYFHGNGGPDTAGVINSWNAYIEFSQVEGLPFDLKGIDLLSGGNYGTWNRRWITTSAGAEYWPNFNSDTQVTRHFDFSGPLYSGITWFRVGTVWYATEIDNVNVVPEPCTMSFVALGVLGGVACVRRARRKPTA